MVYLPGGPTQHETFDPKPQAPTEVRGAYRPISTKIPGVPFCELVPQLAASADRFAIVRTLNGMNNRHESFQCYTGRPGGRSEDNEPEGGWPAFGSVLSQLQGSHVGGVPTYVDASPPMGYGPYNNLGRHDASEKISWPGFTGPRHTPLKIHQGNQTSEFVVDEPTLARLADRRALNQVLNGLRHQVATDGLDSYQQQAYDILTSQRLAEALDLEKESAKVRERYGETQDTFQGFGGAPQSPQHLILARRLIEAGVRCVTVAFGSWDWHANREGPIDVLAKRYLPCFDQALSAFLEDLDQRGLLDRVMVVVWGEFGRTPRINGKGGRDHWPATQSILLTGGGIQGGRMIGATDKLGGHPIDRPVHVQEAFATLYRHVGIDVNNTSLIDLQGRPQRLVAANQQPVDELF